MARVHRFCHLHHSQYSYALLLTLVALVTSPCEYPWKGPWEWVRKEHEYVKEREGGEREKENKREREREKAGGRGETITNTAIYMKN